MYDMVIENGRLITGTGNPWFYGDVALVGDKIVRVGRLDEAEAARRIEAAGCPGSSTGTAIRICFSSSTP